MTLSQIFVAGLFLLVIASLIFTRIRPSLIFASGAAVCFLTGLVPAQ